MIKDTNPDHYRVDGADFAEYILDPKIGGFGDWMFANGYNTGLLEEQMKQKPEKVLSMKHDPVFIDYLTGNCPGCHKHIEQLTSRNYCGYCGKGLMWDG